MLDILFYYNFYALLVNNFILLEVKHPYDLVCPSVGWLVGRTAGRSVSLSVIIYWKGGKLYFHAPIGALGFWIGCCYVRFFFVFLRITKSFFLSLQVLDHSFFIRRKSIFRPLDIRQTFDIRRISACFPAEWIWVLPPDDPGEESTILLPDFTLEVVTKAFDFNNKDSVS